MAAPKRRGSKVGKTVRPNVFGGRGNVKGSGGGPDAGTRKPKKRSGMSYDAMLKRAANLGGGKSKPAKKKRFKVTVGKPVRNYGKVKGLAMKSQAKKTKRG
jgi:hypothetical protein